MARNLIGIRHLERDDIEDLIALGADFKLRVLEDRPLPVLSKKVVGMLFFENSTRTRVSFEQAAHYLSLKTANFTAGSSSMTKGETLKDTILTLRYERLNGLVIRHRLSGAPSVAARHFGGPVLLQKTDHGGGTTFIIVGRNQEGRRRILRDLIRHS